LTKAQGDQSGAGKQRKGQPAGREAETSHAIVSAGTQGKYQEKRRERRSDTKVEASFNNARFAAQYISKQKHERTTTHKLGASLTDLFILASRQNN
jgi:hypothetical protein